MIEEYPTAQEIQALPWERIAPYFQELQEAPLTPESVDAWLAAWTRIYSLLYESYVRLHVAMTVNTKDEAARRNFERFVDTIFPKMMAAEDQLKRRLLESGLEPAGFSVPLRDMRAEAEIYREENLPLISEELKVSREYDRIAGAQTVEWEGKEVTPSQLRKVYLDTDRDRRERAWKLSIGRQIQDREAFNQLWTRLLKLRRQIAANAGFSDYRGYRWKELHRFDYTPEDSRRFQDAIEQVVVPAAERIYARRKAQLGVDRLRPWDLSVDPLGRPPLRPFDTAADLESGVQAIFDQVDPQLGTYFRTMANEKLLDLDNRKDKAPGGYCTSFPVERKPFIFMNAVGVHDDVQTLLHEGGHSFHVFETRSLPYYQQTNVPMEFAEVASMGMELLASPYLDVTPCGFYSPAEAARARGEHIESLMLFWPYMAVVDAFQHWVYTHPEQAEDPANCDAQWLDLWRRFMRGVDWSGLEEECKTGWQRKLHIFQVPFYYIEYGLAQLGAVQIWGNALQDQAKAVADYRTALSLGSTATLPQLFAAAGARFAFDAAILEQAVGLAERKLEDLGI